MARSFDHDQRYHMQYRTDLFISTIICLPAPCTCIPQCHHLITACLMRLAYQAPLLFAAALRCCCCLNFPQLHSLILTNTHHHNIITTPTTTPTHTTMAPSKHSHQAHFLLHALVYIMTFFRRHVRVCTPARPHFELHSASSQSPRLRRAQRQFMMLFFLHSMLRDLLSKLLHRCQPGSSAPSPLTMETVTRHRVSR